MKRRLAAILVGDVVGYSAMMEADEEGTVARITDLAAMAHEKVKAREGRIFKMMGDAVLADFASPLNALRCAVELRNALAEAAGESIQMRFGLHLADVIEAGDDLLGDGINLAARIQAAADPGAIESAARSSSKCGGIHLSPSSRAARNDLRTSQKRSRFIACAASRRLSFFRPRPPKPHRTARNAPTRSPSSR